MCPGLGPPPSSHRKLAAGALMSNALCADIAFLPSSPWKFCISPSLRFAPLFYAHFHSESIFLTGPLRHHSSRYMLRLPHCQAVSPLWRRVRRQEISSLSAPLVPPRSRSGKGALGVLTRFFVLVVKGGNLSFGLYRSFVPFFYLLY